MADDIDVLFSELRVPMFLTFKCCSICSIKMPDKVFELFQNGTNEIGRQLKIWSQENAAKPREKPQAIVFDSPDYMSKIKRIKNVH